MKKSKNKKKKKKTTTTITTNPTNPTNSIDPSSPLSTLPSTPSKKSNTSKSSTPLPSSSTNSNPEGLDEIDLALLAISKKTGLSVPTVASASLESSGSGKGRIVEKKYKDLQECFSFDPKFLDPEVELRKMFGAKVVSTYFYTFSLFA